MGEQVNEVNNVPETPHSHATTGHEFKHKTVPGILCSEDDFIYNILFYDFPMDRLLFSEKLPQRRGITGILKAGVKRGLDEIEKG